MTRRDSLLFACALLAFASACSGGSSSAPQPATSGGETVTGLVTVVGTTDASGVTVSVDGNGPSATTDASGRFSISGVSEGVHSLSFSRGPYGEVVPGLFVYPGGEPVLLDGLGPLPTVELQRARRVATASIPDDFFEVVGDRVFYDVYAGVATSSVRPCSSSSPPRTATSSSTRDRRATA